MESNKELIEFIREKSSIIQNYPKDGFLQKDDVISLSSCDDDDIYLLTGSEKQSTSGMESLDSLISISSDSFSGGDVINDDIFINTHADENDNVSDVNTEVKIKWKSVESPKAWTKSMRKYYNKTCTRQKNFDWKEVLKEIRLERPSRWHILKEDIFQLKIKSLRCQFCRQTDHLARNCPRKAASCTMCGTEGHFYQRCPERMCLNCGRPNKDFKSFCKKCDYTKEVQCTTCNKIGHESKNCPDLWRSYHCTVPYKDINCTPTKLNPNIQCCNCARRGHLFEECLENYDSLYPPTSCFVTNYDMALDKMCSLNQTKVASHSNHRLKMQYFSKRPNDEFTNDDEGVSHNKYLKLNRQMPRRMPNYSNDPFSYIPPKKKRRKKKKTQARHQF